MHRWLSITVCALSVALVGAGAPFPSNTPSAVVFTLVPSGSASLESAARIAAALSVRIGANGTVAVKSAPGEVKQADFLPTAQKLGVDYYVSGFVAPFGGGYSVALQLVSTQSGVSVWSGTATLSGTDDVTDAADVIDKVISQRASVGYGPAPAAGGGAPTAAPGPAQTAPPAAAAQPAVAAAAPAGTPNPRAGQTIAVLDSLDAMGGMLPQEINYTTDAIAEGIQRQGIVATRWHKKAPALDVSGALLCNDTKTGSVIEPTIYTEHTDPDAGNGIYYTIHIQITGFDCATHAIRKFATSNNSAWNWKQAADRSIGDAVKRLVASTSSSN